MSSLITPQFRNTSNRLIRDVTIGLKRQLTDPNWIGGFCFPMIGSVGHECGGFKLMEEGKPTVAGSLGGISFAQWTGVKATPPVGRRKQFMDFCRAHHLHPYSYDAAVGFIIYELTTTAKGVVNATLNASPVDGEQYGIHGADPALLGRVIKFEKLYENAGVKHYPSRYAYAVAARDCYLEWAKAGFPEPEKYVMPPARFSVQFDKEFGRGESETTTRWDSAKAALALPDGRTAVITGGGDTKIIEHEDPAAALDGAATNMPEAQTRKGGWPEDRLSKDEIEAIQLRLRALGYVIVGVADGKWGTNTTAAVKALQVEAGIAEDGHYGTATRKALMDGIRHKVPEERANATAKELLVAGEPTMAAVHPVSLTSKIGTVFGAGTALITGITSAWPQASTTIDMVKGYFADVPGWVWFAAITVVAAYLWLSTRQVKQSVVAGYREGSVRTLAKPLHADDRERVGFMPPVPDTPPADDANAAWATRAKAALDDLFPRDHDSPTSEPDRPLGTE